MATFVGTEEEFNLFIMPSVRNWVQTLTKPYKRKRDNICQHCGEKHELQAAHVHGRERKVIVRSVLEAFEKDGMYHVDLDVFKQKVLAAHDPVEKNFLFLCQKCHREYDAHPNQNASLPLRQSTQITHAVAQSADSVPPKSDVKGPIDTQRRQGESVQDFVKRSFIALYSQGYLDGREIERLHDLEYSKRTFGIAYPFLVDQRSECEPDGQLRYWVGQATPYFNRFYICSQWWKPRFDEYDKKLKSWIEYLIRRKGSDGAS